MPYDAVTKATDTASISGPKNNQVYTNPKYLVNIVTGASGDKEGETPCVVNILAPSVTCDVDYGYGIWTGEEAPRVHASRAARRAPRRARAACPRPTTLAPRHCPQPSTRTPRLGATRASSPTFSGPPTTPIT
jgi:hypothetical protein